MFYEGFGGILSLAGLPESCASLIASCSSRSRISGGRVVMGEPSCWGLNKIDESRRGFRYRER
jgi:hypothetical protein